MTVRALFDLPPGHTDYESSRVAVLPVPYERTTSYGKGTRGGPRAILEASRQVELYDEELDLEAYREGIAALPELDPDAADPAAALAQLEAASRRHLEAGKFLVVLGGEHALTAAPVRAARAVFGELGVVQFDAHADLRDRYEGSPLSHACVMRRIFDDGLPAVSVGVRAVCREEMELIRSAGLQVVWGRELAGLDEERFQALLESLPPRVYLTFDLDFFDPSLLPATGTPEPGGGRWYPTLALLRRLFAAREVVAMDLVELSPIPGQPASDFLAARLLYKCLGYRIAGRRDGR